jgi:hypothetical protein
MPIVGGLDIHRKQISFDCVDTETGELERGRIAPADRAHLADGLARHWPAGPRCIWHSRDAPGGAMSPRSWPVPG